MTHSVEQTLEIADIAQNQWALELPRNRLRMIGKLPARLAARFTEFLPAIHRPNATDAEKLSSEILPLADACRYTARIGRQALASRSVSMRYGAWWLGHVGVRITREAWGTILIIGPSNYPLFLPGVQMIQALAAGNAVVVKPAPGGEPPMELLKQCLIEAGLPQGLIHILPSSIEAAQATMRQGVDKVILTGSIHTGRAVLRELAESLTPSTMELSGCDAVFLLPQADLARAVATICYALKLNGGATCIAPRRLFVTRDLLPKFSELLKAALLQNSTSPQAQLTSAAIAMTHRTANQALAQGAEVLCGQIPEPNDSSMSPLILTKVTADMEIARSDLFAPVACILQVDSMEKAIDLDRRCPYSLGAAVFGPQSNAEHLAAQIAAGCVVVNDLIVPTADPRIPFGGRDQSGWGTTRGADGLLEMTRLKTVCIRRGKWLPHLNAKDSQDLKMLSLLLQVFHASGLRARVAALREIISRARQK